ncbi:zeta toxin family protein [Agrobacterium rosae]|uniref:zeta toxin family protein n=1 Tax=Agrobacterium rosae TaxID=1972867 RepID=UPI002A1042BD|nr:zeta toxin family protein [Agrobacterium rosae]MDX8312922.1 zeta toxin family protein [Agrobacterium rosae]
MSCILLAGSNGSRKSSAFTKLDLEGVWINADKIAKAIPSDCNGRSTDMQAGRAALMKIGEMKRTRQSFIFETTLSSQQSIRLMQEAKQAGFTVGLYYVAPDSVETNVERVRQRVLKGGHDIPEENIRRYKGSLMKLTEALRIADEVPLIDNSSLEPHEVIAISSGVVQSFDIDDSQELHVQMTAKVCEAYDLVRVQEGFRSTHEGNKALEKNG